MTLQQEGAASRLVLLKLLSYKADEVEVLDFFSSVRWNQSVGRSKVVHVAVVVFFPVGSKPPATVVVRISKGERHDSSAAAPFSTTTSSLQRRVGGSIFSLKMVEPFGPPSILFA